jgi:multidrug efflux pump
VQLRVSGGFTSVDEIRNFPIRATAEDLPPRRRRAGAPRLRRSGGAAHALPGRERHRHRRVDEAGRRHHRAGRALEAEFGRLQKTLPVGMELSKVSDQPAAVRDSVAEFVESLCIAVAIVLLVSFFSLGAAPALVVALTIPLVLAMTFAAMHYFDIGLHKISLGALVLALGLLVDDAIIAVEMMAVKMEQGMNRLAAASFAYRSTAFPMLTGTLVTAAGFLPIATAQSGTGEYTRSIFQVVTIALLLSWIAAVVFIPFLGDCAAARAGPPSASRSRGAGTWRASASRCCCRLAGGAGRAGAADGARRHQRSLRLALLPQARGWIAWCVANRAQGDRPHRAAFVVSLALFRFVPQQFFPSSTRLELVVDLELAEGASLTATEAARSASRRS